jgi:hypothetical protein
MDDEFSKLPKEREFIDRPTTAVGTLNMALLFGTAVIALSLILTPLLASDNSRMEARGFIEYDDIKTGSIPTGDGKVKHYTIRRSVLSEKPGEVCIIDHERRRSGC